VLAQTSAILSYLGKKHGLAPTSDEDIAKCDQLSADASDVWSEVFKHSKDEDKGAAFLAADGRLAAWFVHFEKALGVTSGPFFFGENPTYADFNLLGLIDLLQFYFEDRFAPLVSDNLTNWLGACCCRNSYMAIQAGGVPILPASFK
jgi:glutathione S-transferase